MPVAYLSEMAGFRGVPSCRCSVILLESFWLVQGFPFLGNGQSEFPEVQRDGTKSRLLST